MTVNVCLVCLNHFKNEHFPISSEHNENSLLLNRFLKFVQNYLQLSSATSEFFPKIAEGEVFCEKCELVVISPICQVYLEFLSKQLRLSWELNQLAKLLDKSNCSVESEESRVSKFKSLSLQLGIDSVSGVNEFRTLLTEKCIVKEKETLPFISLERDMPPNSFTSDSGFRRNCENSVGNLAEAATVLQDENDFKTERESLNGDNDADDSDDTWEPEDLEAHDSDDSLQFSRGSGPILNYPASSSINEKEGEMNLDKRLIKIEVYHDDDDGESQLVQTREEFDIDKDTKLEVRLIKNQENHACPHCSKVFPQKANLNMHITRKHPTPQQLVKRCKFCFKTFLTKENLGNHLRQVHAGRRHTCSDCKSSFKLLCHLKEHIASVHKPQPTCCKHCGKIYKNDKYLKEHVARVHADPTSKQSWPKCPNCGKQFFRRDRLKRHIRICSASSLRKRKKTRAN